VVIRNKNESSAKGNEYYNIRPLDVSEYFEEQQGNNLPIATPIHKVCNISVEAKLHFLALMLHICASPLHTTTHLWREHPEGMPHPFSCIYSLLYRKKKRHNKQIQTGMIDAY